VRRPGHLLTLRVDEIASESALLDAYGVAARAGGIESQHAAVGLISEGERACCMATVRWCIQLEGNVKLSIPSCYRHFPCHPDDPQDQRTARKAVAWLLVKTHCSMCKLVMLEPKAA